MPEGVDSQDESFLKRLLEVDVVALVKNNTRVIN
jgi:hypothetical protein